MRAFIIMTSLWIAVSARAEPSVEIEEGMRVVLDGANVSLLLQGKPIWTEPVSEKEAGGKGTLEMHRLADQLTAIHAVVPLKGGGRAEAVLVKTAGRTDVKIVWGEETSLKGDIGERIGKAVRFQDLTGDGKPEIVTGEIHEMVRLCGQERLPLLFRAVFDPKSGVFRPVLAKRPELKAPMDIEGTSSSEPALAPLVEPLAPASASRSLGDQGRASSLSIPKETTDRDLSTAWVPFPRNGAGEFTSYRTASDVYGLTELGIRPLPTEKGQRKKTDYDRPKTLIVTTEQNVYRLSFKADPKTNSEAVYWFELPKADKTHCLSLIVESSYEPSEKRLLPIAELYARTEIDGVEGLERLAADLGDPHRRRQASLLLKKTGRACAGAIKKSWPKLDVSGRRLAVDVLSETAPGESIDLFVETVLGNDDLAKATALKGLSTSPEKAVTSLAKHLDTEDDAVFETAAAVLGSLDTPAALTALISRAGKGGRARRAALRLILIQTAANSEERSEQVWAELQKAESSGETEKRFDLLRASAEMPSLGERVHAAAVRIYDESRDFADRYRALEALGKLGCAFPRDRLLAAASDDDTFIRKVAVEGLGVCKAPKETTADVIQGALSDEAPLVRLSGLDAVESAGLVRESFERLRQLSKADPWPVVRAKTVTVSRQLSNSQALRILEGAAQDESASVREAVLDSAIEIDDKRAGALIVSRLADENESSRVKLKAAVAIGRRCQEGAEPSLLAVLKKGAEPLAKKADIEVAVAAAKALGAIGGKEAVSALKEASRRSNPATDKAIAAALKDNGASCKSK